VARSLLESRTIAHANGPANRTSAAPAISAWAKVTRLKFRSTCPPMAPTGSTPRTSARMSPAARQRLSRCAPTARSPSTVSLANGPTCQSSPPTQRGRFCAARRCGAGRMWTASRCSSCGMTRRSISPLRCAIPRTSRTRSGRAWCAVTRCGSTSTGPGAARASAVSSRSPTRRRGRRSGTGSRRASCPTPNWFGSRSIPATATSTRRACRSTPCGLGMCGPEWKCGLRRGVALAATRFLI